MIPRAEEIGWARADHPQSPEDSERHGKVFPAWVADTCSPALGGTGGTAVRAAEGWRSNVAVNCLCSTFDDGYDLFGNPFE